MSTKFATVWASTRPWWSLIPAGKTANSRPSKRQSGALPEGQTDGLILFLVDHPLVKAAMVDKLVTIFMIRTGPIVVPKFRGKRGHPVIFAQRLYGELLDAPQNEGARAVVWAHAEEVLEIPTDEEGVVLNLNDPATLQRALAAYESTP